MVGSKSEKRIPALLYNGSPVQQVEKVVASGGVGDTEVSRSPRLVEPSCTEEPGSGPGRSVDP